MESILPGYEESGTMQRPKLLSNPGGDGFAAYSAGLRPAGEIDPLALKVPTMGRSRWYAVLAILG
jgi:hypothetical protein